MNEFRMKTTDELIAIFQDGDFSDRIQAEAALRRRLASVLERAAQAAAQTGPDKGLRDALWATADRIETALFKNPRAM